MITLGVDTSNYATSVALYNSNTKAIIAEHKAFLPVKEGEVGLRQSDAVFEHVRQLPKVLQELTEYKEYYEIDGVGVSVKPRNHENSYMPCFLAGKLAASAIALQAQKPLFEFSHQEGHIAAALFGAEQLDLWNKQFFVFHVSGGTTDLILANGIYETEEIGTSSDLYAGQAIDRLGQLLELPFPSGEYISNMAELSTAKIEIKKREPAFTVSFSGLENQFRKKIQDKELAEDVCKYTLLYIAETLSKMADAACSKYGELPIIASGGVMGSKVIAEYLLKKHEKIYFAPAKLSSDNAVGIAILASKGK